jgi:L-alanine-DL-glutamate epimerase-like enolase superfamily enzyme
VQLGGLYLGVKTAYSVHLQSTIPNATLPCDELPFIRVADVLEEGLGLKDGHFTVPQKPGLGVTLNMEVVEKYRVG